MRSGNACLHILDTATLARAREHLLDALLSLDTIRFDRVERTCYVQLLLPDRDLSQYIPLWAWFAWRITPLRRWDLVLHGVSTYRITHSGVPLQAGMYSVANLAFDMQNGFSIVTHEAMTIHFAIFRLEGELIETEQLDWDKSLRSFKIQFCGRKKGSARVDSG